MDKEETLTLDSPEVSKLLYTGYRYENVQLLTWRPTMNVLMDCHANRIPTSDNYFGLPDRMKACFQKNFFIKFETRSHFPDKPVLFLKLTNLWKQ